MRTCRNSTTGCSVIVLLTGSHPGNQMEKNKMGGGPVAGAYRDFVGKIEVRHPRCVGSITKEYCVLHVQSNKLYFTQWYSKNTTTCFGPICWSSSGCDLTYRAAIQDLF